MQRQGWWWWLALRLGDANSHHRGPPPHEAQSLGLVPRYPYRARGLRPRGLPIHLQGIARYVTLAAACGAPPAAARRRRRGGAARRAADKTQDSGSAMPCQARPDSHDTC
eukprot:COSAG01_NODE_1096_length_11713_cov_213.007060_11_plen_110_part_00